MSYCSGNIIDRKSEPVMRESGDDEVGHGGHGLRLGDPRVGGIGGGLRRGDRLVHLPGERGTVGRVLGQQVVQDGGPGSGLAHDHDRTGDRPVGHLGVLPTPVQDPEPGGQVVDHLGLDDGPAQVVQTCRSVEAVEQADEALLPGVLAEVAAAGGRHGGLHHGIGIESFCGHVRPP
jgi:hypothetical protein